MNELNYLRDCEQNMASKWNAIRFIHAGEKFEFYVLSPKEIFT